MADLLTVQDLWIEFTSKRGTVKAVNGVDFSLRKGKTTGIVGESGSGKSVTVKSIAGLLARNAKVTGGSIDFEGCNLLSLKEKQIQAIRGNKISMVFQDPNSFMNPTISVGKQVMEPLLFHSVCSRKEAKERAIDMLAQVGIPSPAVRFNEYPFEYSGGMLQRALIAMALINDPTLLIADEPTTALDVTVQAQILFLLKKMKETRDMSMILVTHDLIVAAQICDEIVVMYGGMVVERAETQTFLKRRAHPYSIGLLASTPRVDASIERLKPIEGSPPDLRGALPQGCLFAPRCPYRTERCTAERPPLQQIGPNHQVACWQAESEVAVS
ncbi:oligopeptide transport system ATP-binding protein [Paenibacillus taihuensis]|uniref:Oligopeptide transport system ATP-binding protein n=1 Tax=Paenibacillus taihuensis TaxID=1156355 RepID=A0A3D9R114_9BACL|nr:ABC transporter ATP-binding protein [Paenibacillus taihuensis]REE67324.1 oligopeptide transport system ATP-binding protein [Paenibacillus taihuensis]